MQNSKLLASLKLWRSGQFKIQKFWKTIRYTLDARRSQIGFTLVEMLIYMGLLSMLLVMLVDIFASSLDVQLESQSSSAVEQDGRFLLERFTYDIHNSSNVVIPADLGQQSSTLQITVNSISYAYTLSNGNVQLTNSNGTDMLSSADTSVSNLNFQRLGNINGKDTVKVTFTVTSRIMRTNVIETKDFQTTVGLR